MSFCSNCGSPLAAGAHFCAHCGTAIGGATASAPARVTSFEGELRKCPSCGGTWNSLSTTCAVCGYERRGARVAGSVESFYREIDAVSSDTSITEAERAERIVNKIRYYPVPNAKEDLFEFIAMARVRMGREYYGHEFTEPEREMAAAWAAKYEELYVKAKITYGTTPEFRDLKKMYSRDKKAAKRALNAIVSTPVPRTPSRGRHAPLSSSGATYLSGDDEDTVITPRGVGKWFLFFLCLFFGYLGVHRFVEGRYLSGVIYLFTTGLFGIGWFVDLVRILFRPA